MIGNAGLVDRDWLVGQVKLAASLAAGLASVVLVGDEVLGGQRARGASSRIEWSVTNEMG